MVTFVFPGPGQGSHEVIAWCMAEWGAAHPLGMRPGIWQYPEAKLHPSLRARIADKAVERAKDGRDFFVVTHECTVAMRLRRLYDPSLTRIVAFAGGVPHEVRVTGGRFDRWPGAFWTERSEELLALPGAGG